MTKRMLISGLWFISIWGIGGALHLLFDVPRALTLVPAVTVAVAMWIGLARYDVRLATRRMPEGATSRYRAESTVRAPALKA